MRAVLTLMLKDLRLLRRDRMGLFFTLIFPLIYAIFFGTIMLGLSDDEEAGGSGIAILVVDEDSTDASRRFVEALEKSGNLSVEIAPSRAAAFDRVAGGKIGAFVRIPAGYGAASERLFWGEPRTLEVGVDPSRGAEGGMLQGILMKVAFESMTDAMLDKDAMGRSMALARESLEETDVDAEERGELRSFFDSVDEMVARIPEADPAAGSESGGAGLSGWQPVVIETTKVMGGREGPAITSSFAISFPQAIVWAVMGAAATFGISLVTERSRGTLTRLRTAPLAQAQILLGKGGACFFTTITVAVVLLFIAAVAFGVRPGWAALPKLAAAIVSVAVCFVGIMMLLSVIGRTEAAAGGIGWAVLTVMAMIGGGMIPLFLLKGWMQTLSSFSPVKWAILALEGVLWRGFDWSQMVRPCLVLAAIGLVGFLGGAAIFGRRA
jgi:ABC-2 type transport system permease protein